MSGTPAWLGAEATTDGSWATVVTDLYAVFHADFVVGKPKLGTMPVWWDQHRARGAAYEEGFWHLVTRTDDLTMARVPDFPRARKLPWCAPIILHSTDAYVTAWRYQEGNGKVRTYLWVQPDDYVIVLEERTARLGQVAFLVTAYAVDGESTRRNLARKLANRQT